MSGLRFLIVLAFVLAITLGGVAGYLSVDPLPPQLAPASPATEPATPAPQASDDGDYGPDWPVCRDRKSVV
mgnify:CR=1 FL=1